MSPDDFRARCLEITQTMSGHEAHRAFDRACEDALRTAGYGDGVLVFENSVASWHQPHHPYPHQGPCPDCEKPGV